ncbi:hypothetical protein AB0L00_04970 [Actinoallomurus sp. NPDC052308]|uniref:hypothetical protein n=1 Tax=Actinoallomurus sp. NPDC052308 TaxID=3155530 RepID=UPI003444B000
MLVSASMTASAAYHHYVSNPDRWGPPPPYMTYMLIPGALIWLICTLAEVVLARSLGSAYPPLGPLAGIPESALPQVARSVMRGLDRRLGSGGGCAALIAMMVAGPALVLTWSFVTAHAMALWLLVLAAATAADLVKVVRTLRRRLCGLETGVTRGDVAYDPNHGE